MAKRTPSRSEADDAAGATPGTPKPRRARAAKSSAPAAPGAPVPASETQAVRAEADDTNALAIDPGPRPESLDALTSESMSMASEPSEHDIRMRAYQRYLERGGGHGQAFDDWVEAERELRTRK
jgi:hypothetical protein